MSEPIYSRAPDVVWRLGPDRVLVRRIGTVGDEAAAELMGEAALVYIALDEPATVEGLSARTEALDVDPLSGLALDRLLAAGWIASTRSVTDRGF